MPEVERKFLIDAESVDVGGKTHTIRQGYIAVMPSGVEVRVRDNGDARSLTVKGAGTLSRAEVDLALTVAQFEELWPLTDGLRIEKRRTRLQHGDHLIEVDSYGGLLDGLRVAEVEFDSQDQAMGFVPPDWFGREVTDDPRYKNQTLAREGKPQD